MGNNRTIDWAATAVSTLEWWQDAGVDVLVDDAPRDRINSPETVIDSAASTPASSPAMLPDTLAQFLAWRGGPDAPEASWNGVHFSASGPEDAAVMILVDCPDRDDAQSGILASGLSGKLLDRMLRAIGFSRTSVRLGSVCAKRPASGRIGRDVEERLHELARHHVALVRPQRLLTLGDTATRAVLSTDLVSARGSSHLLNHAGGETTVVASFHPRLLVDRPGLKGESWRDLRMLVKGMGE